MQNGRFLLGNGAPTQPQLQIAQPMNDVQLVALIAAKIDGSAPERVTLALNIVVEAVIQTANLPALVRARQQAGPG